MAAGLDSAGCRQGRINSAGVTPGQWGNGVGTAGAVARMEAEGNNGDPGRVQLHGFSGVGMSIG